MRIISFKVTMIGYDVTVLIDGERVTASTFWDIDGGDKVRINGELYQLKGLDWMEKVS